MKEPCRSAFITDLALPSGRVILPDLSHAGKSSPRKSGRQQRHALDGVDEKHSPRQSPPESGHHSHVPVGVHDRIPITSARREAKAPPACTIPWTNVSRRQHQAPPAPRINVPWLARSSNVRAVGRAHPGKPLRRCLRPGNELLNPVVPVSNTDVATNFKIHKQEGDERAITRNAAQLESQCPNARWNAMNTLYRISPKSDHFAMDAVSARMEHGNEHVRKTASKTLGRIVLKGDIYAVDLAVDRLQHKDSKVRDSAVDSLLEVAGKGNSNVVSAVAALLTHDDPVIRQTATDTLAKIADKGDDNAIASVSCWLQHPNPSVVESSMEALSVMGKPDARLLTEQLTSADAKQRRAAVCQFGDFEGDHDAMAYLAGKLEHPDAAVRKAVVKALSIVTREDKGDPEAIASVVGHLEHGAQHLRRDAVHALAAIAEKGDKDVVAAIVKRLEHGHVGVRSSAIDALRRLVDKDDPGAMEVILQRLGHTDERVRLSAAKALGTIASRGQSTAITGAMYYLQNGDAELRKTAVKALGGIVDRNDSKHLPSVLASLEDIDYRVRETTLKALKDIMDIPIPIVKTPRGYMLRSQLRGQLGKHKQYPGSRKSSTQRSPDLPCLEFDAPQDDDEALRRTLEDSDDGSDQENDLLGDARDLLGKVIRGANTDSAVFEAPPDDSPRRRTALKSCMGSLLGLPS